MDGYRVLDRYENKRGIIIGDRQTRTIDYRLQ